MRQYSERLFDNSCKDTLPFLSSVSKTEGFLHVVRSCVTLRGVRLEGSRGRPFVLAASGRPLFVFLRGVSPEGPQKEALRSPFATFRASAEGRPHPVILRAVRPEGSQRRPFAAPSLRYYLEFFYKPLGKKDKTFKIKIGDGRSIV